MGSELDPPYGSTPFRRYESDELRTDGYPFAWHKLADPEHTELLDAADLVLPSGVKDVVRAFAGHRCERCGHPYRVGSCGPDGPGWTNCDGRCRHQGPFRHRRHESRPWEYADEMGQAQDGRYKLILNGEHVQAAWRVLTVHHLNGDKADLRWWNLAALCQRCHLTVQGRVVMERAFILEHSQWFRIHAAGWYAAKYEGRDVTREEAQERLGELLAYESLVLLDR